MWQSKIKVAIISKLMPLYRLGVFQQLSNYKGNLEFTFFGDTKEQGGIEIIDWSYSSKPKEERINWVKTKNYFYKPERLLWQTGIIKRILFSDYKVFVFEGAIAHYPIWLFAFLCKRAGKKVLFWTHGFKGLDKGIKKKIRILFFKHLADGLLLYGHFQKKIMIADGFNPSKLFIIYNSLQPEKQFETIKNIDKNVVAKEKKQLFKIPNAFTFIFIGRLVEGKKVMEIVKAMKLLRDKKIETNCIFIGEGPEKQKIIEFSKENKIKENLYFTGALYREEEIAMYFAMADLMISPGNVGLNCIHSLAYGVPVITHNNFSYQNPEVEAIINEETGVFYKYNDMNDMLLKLENWIKTDKKRKDIFNNCQDIIKTIYNPENQSKCIANAVKQIVKNEK
ncbi:glycosyltransferase [Lutibacter sp.]